MAMQTWEYRVLNGAISEHELNDLGAEGWELVATVGAPSGPTLYLKRPRLGFKETVTLEQREKYARIRGEGLED